MDIVPVVPIIPFQSCQSFQSNLLVPIPLQHEHVHSVRKLRLAGVKMWVSVRVLAVLVAPCRLQRQHWRLTHRGRTACGSCEDNAAVRIRTSAREFACARGPWCYVQLHRSSKSGFAGLRTSWLCFEARRGTNTCELSATEGSVHRNAGIQAAYSGARKK